MKFYIRFGSSSIHLLVQDCLFRASSNMALSLNLHITSPHDRWGDQIFGIREADDCDCLWLGVFADSWGRLTSFRGDSFTPAECLALLRRASRLVRCEFCTIDEVDESPSSTAVTRILLPDLDYLVLTCRQDLDGWDEGCLVVLDSLDAPRLRDLYLLCSFPFPAASLVSFLQRTPGIQIFTAVFDDPVDGIEDGVAPASSIFGAMLSLTNLSLHLDTEGLFFQILTLLKQSPTFFPHLQAINFSVAFIIGWDEDYTETLVNALRGRKRRVPLSC
jgi:hypothetical protein